MHFCESFFTYAKLRGDSGVVRRWDGGRPAAWEDVRMRGWEEESMRGWEDERTGGRREEEGWSEEEDKAVYHDSLERVCPRQTPSRSPSPGRRYVIIYLYLNK